jgi:hypothetical protein
MAMSKKLTLVIVLALSAGCTTLGPTPATTGLSPVPVPRPGGELGFGFVPGYYLSNSVEENPSGRPVQQATLMLEPGSLIGLPGASIGGRYVGKKEEGGYAEPMLRYRLHLDQEKRAALGINGFVTHASGENKQASYEMTRGGAEVIADYRMTTESEYIEVHVFGGAQLTALKANGEYCRDQKDLRFGADCPDPPAVPDKTKSEVAGFYPAATGGAALEFARHLSGVMHGIRLAGLAGFGSMPRVESSEQQSARFYGTFGGMLTIGLGGAE